MTIVYVLDTNNFDNAIKTAMDIYSSTGMKPSVISNNSDNYKFDCKDAAMLSSGIINGSDYAEKHIIK